MATCRFKNGKYRYTIKRKKLLPKPIYLSFEDKHKGDAYTSQLEALLDQGIVPDEFLNHQSAIDLHSIIDEYIRIVSIKEDSKKLLYTQQDRIENIKLGMLSYQWCEEWISNMKHHYKLKPSTIQKHVGALTRCLDWALTKELIHVNHLRKLPKGYATYTETDSKIAGEYRINKERERRLEPGEEDRIRLVLMGKHKPINKQRVLKPDEPQAMTLLFEMALETAMRLREMYTIELRQVDFDKRTIYLNETKNGSKRQVPMSSHCVKILKEHIDKYNPQQFLFPWFTGIRTERALRKITSSLSTEWRRVFEHAECEGLRFHDLRHEATSRLYERTSLTDLQIAKITGHKDLRMLSRYANLRASDLADQLW